MLPPNEKKDSPNWILQLLRDIKWNKYFHEPEFQAQLNTVVKELQNYTDTSKISPSQIQQIALKHEDIYKFMNHVSWQIHHKQSRKYVLLCFSFRYCLYLFITLSFSPLIHMHSYKNIYIGFVNGIQMNTHAPVLKSIH